MALDRIIIVFVLCLGPLWTPGQAAAQEPPEVVLDELGMPPRPTLDCGGREAIQQWERERGKLLNRRARDLLVHFRDGYNSRLNETTAEAVLAMSKKRLAAVEACIAEEPTLDLVCVAAATRQPDLCLLKGGAENLSVRFCRYLSVAVVAALERDHLRCAGLGDVRLRRLCERAALGRPKRSIGCGAEDVGCKVMTFFNHDVCRRLWPLVAIGMPPDAIWYWILLTEAFRTAPEGRPCAAAPASLRGLCDAVVSGKPSRCSVPSGKHWPVVSGRACRNEQVLVPEIPMDQVPYGKGLVVTVPMMNPFFPAAECRLTLRLSDGDGVRTVAVSEPFVLPGQSSTRASEAFVSKRFRMAPADTGLELTATADCSWTLDRSSTPTRSDGVPVMD